MDNFILFTLKSSLCLSAGYLFYYLLLKRETFHRFNRFVLLGIIILSMIIPLTKLHTGSTVINLPVQKLESTLSGEVPVMIPEKQPAQLPLHQSESRPVNFLLLSYLAGAAFQLLLIFYSLVRILLFLKKSKKLTYGGIRFTLVSSDTVPFCFGRRIVVSEKYFIENSKEVILHEQTHLKEGHGLDLFISELYLIITWYNPVSWLIRHELKQNHEFEADRNVLRQGVDESDYQLLLVKTVAGEPRFHLVNQFNQSSIKTRITMMNKRKSNPRAILKALLFLPLIALMVHVFAQKEIKPTGVASLNQPQGKYLVLKPEQLKTLGFEFNSDGLFYKNERPNQVEYKSLVMTFTKKVYSCSVRIRKGENPGHFPGEKIINKMTATTFDFFPLAVSNFKGQKTIGTVPLQKYEKEKLLPVQVNMADLHIIGRSDTLLFWFQPTESLKQILLTVKLEDYLQTCPPDSREAAIKGKKGK
jgi:hypothetical protein